jgi:hypothetical protein
MLDWNNYQAELTKGLPDFAKLSPDSLKGYQTLSAANAKNSLIAWRKSAATPLHRRRGYHTL